MDILTFKIIAFAAILFTGITGGLLSVRLALSKQSQRLFSLGNAFAGGIFLSAGLIHMIPDAQEGFRSFAADFPWATFVCALGFVLVLFLDKILVFGHDTVVESARQESQEALQPYILMLVLSVHSIIVGIALGTEQTMSQSLIILAAILAHKGSAAFALGVSLFRGGISKARLIKIIFFFSLMTPLGLLAGTILTALMTGKAEQVATSIFDALAAGTFIYIAVLGIINKEFSEDRDKWLKLIMLAFGLGIMSSVAIWT